MILPLASAALAAPLLVPGPDPGQAARRARLDLGARDVEIREVGDLPRSDDPYLVRTGPAKRCAGTATTEGIRRWLSEAEELRVVMRADEALERLEQAREGWICLGEPAEATLGARLHFLLGGARHAHGDHAGARQAFRAALRSDPDLGWDPDFAPDARPALEAERDAVNDPVRITVVPADAPVALRVDGRSVTVRRGGFDLVPGRHLIQAGDATLWVDVREDDWLVVPRYVDPSLVARVGTVEGRVQLTGLVAELSEPVLVPDQRETWRWHDDRWTVHRAPLARRASRPLALSGAAVLLAGATWMVAERVAADARAAAVDGDLDTPGYEALQDRDQAGRTRFGVATAVASAGALGAGLGVTWGVTWVVTKR